MGKKRKTLKQKRMAESRHLKDSPELVSTSSSLTPTPVIQPTLSYTFQAQPKKIAAVSYSLGHDLKKTIFVSGGIILFQLILSFLLHKHALMIPLVSRY